MSAHNELVLKLEPNKRVEVESWAIGDNKSQYLATFSGESAPDFVALLGRAERLRPRIHQLIEDRKALSPDVEEYGRELFNELFRGEPMKGLDIALKYADVHRYVQRIRIQGPPQLQRLPYELMCREDAVPDGPLLLNGNVTLMRSFPNPPDGMVARTSKPLRMLVVVCSPLDRIALRARDEIDRLVDSLHDLIRNRIVRLDFVHGADTLANLEAAMRKPCDILHFIGHGEESEGNACLAFEGSRRMAKPVGIELWRRIQGVHAPRLVVLNVCKGAAEKSANGFANLAHVFLQCGTPAAVAHQTDILDDLGVAFTGSLYNSIGNNDPVDLAMARARQSLQDTMQWHSPVLFLHHPNGRIFTADVLVEGAVAAPLPVPREKAVQAEANKRWAEAASYARVALTMDQEDWEARRISETARAEEEFLQSVHFCVAAMEHSDWAGALESLHACPVPATHPEDERQRIELLRLSIAAQFGVADPLSLRRNPYDLIAPHGGYPELSTRNLNNIQLPFDAEANEAFRLLRKPNKRLDADFMLFRATIRDRWRTQFLPTVEEKLLDPARGREPFPPARQLHAVYEFDSALILLLTGMRRDARAHLLEAVREDSQAGQAAHWLALMSWSDAIRAEESRSYAAADEAWRETIAFWTRTLSDDGYWARWSRERQNVYGNSLQPEQTAEVRSQLREKLFGEFAAYSHRYMDSGEADRARRFRELEALYQTEWLAAAALNDTADVCQDAPLRGGPEFARIANMGARIAAHSLACLEAQAAEKTVTSESARRIRLLFSWLAAPTALIEIGRPVDGLGAIERLPELAEGWLSENPAYSRLTRARQIFEQDTAFLKIMAWLAISEAAVTGQVAHAAGAESAWRSALECARGHSLEAEAVNRIRDLVVGRASKLAESEDSDGFQSLGQAIEILRSAYAVLPDDEEISVRLAAELARRARRHEHIDHHVQAYQDLREAVGMFPDNLEILDDFCMVLVFWARDLRAQGQTYQAREKLNLSVKRAKWALGRQAHDELAETLRQAEAELQILDGKDLRDAAYQSLDQHLMAGRGADDTPEDRAAMQTERANRMRESGLFCEAIGILKEALATCPGYPWARKEMAIAYKNWVRDLYRQGQFVPAETAIDSAETDGCDPEEFSRMREMIGEAKKLHFGGDERDGAC